MSDVSGPDSRSGADQPNQPVGVDQFDDEPDESFDQSDFASELDADGAAFAAEDAAWDSADDDAEDDDEEPAWTGSFAAPADDAADEDAGHDGSDDVLDAAALAVYRCDDPAERSSGMREAKLALSRSGLVVLPTDTVYGVAADAFDPTGVRRLLRAKGRSRKMPTPVLVASVDTLKALATGLSPQTRELAEAFWPGGLTLICRQQPTLRWDIGDSRATVALRVPDQEDTLALLADVGPLAVSSANLTGQPPAQTVDEAVSMLGDSVDVYLDGGPSPGPTASTIVDATGDVLRMVRSGVIPLDRLRDVVPDLLAPEPD